MSLHKLTAGDGYTYLTRQVAPQDATARGFTGLGDYYAQKGESPGVWLGAGRCDLPELIDNPVVREAQMTALFGEGRHPDADRIEKQMPAAGHGVPATLAATRLGSPFRLYDGITQFRRRVADAFGEHNAALGFPRDWPLPPEDRARIRTHVATAMFTETYGRAPADARELSGFVAAASRQKTTAVAGYDLTFSPVKSVSALWALAPREVAEQIEAAHDAAIRDTLRWLEDTAVFTRTGRNGVAQVETHGLIAAAFVHRDSRAGDPDLHTHVAISNKVRTAGGRWLALDGRPLHKHAVAASERYNTRLEAELTHRLGVRFSERAGPEPGKRPVREIDGIDPRLLTRWSARRAAIDSRRTELAARFQADHGRTPTVVEALKLAQQATLETREAKHEPRSLADQRAAWQAQAHEVLGGQAGLAGMLTAALDPKPDRRMAPEWSPGRVADAAERVLATVQAHRATWQHAHVRAEAERVARAADTRLRDVDEVVDRIVAAALSPALSTPLGTVEDLGEPRVLRRADGTSVYVTAGSQLYTSAAILTAERQLVTAARRRDGRTVAPMAVELALTEAAANGVAPTPAQAQLVRELATSGARLQLALAPAGTGKTTAMRVLARAWAADGGTVVGLAPSAAAAAVLREEIDVHTDTLAKLLHALDGDNPEDWVAGIDAGTLVIVDEAGMAGTTELARTVAHVTARGGSLRLIGDDQQLAAIGAGGVLRDIADTAGAVTLSQVLRFTDPAEGAASLALRAGDSAALGFYLDHGRVHVGDAGTVTDQAYTAWAADRAAGRDAIMLAPTRELVAQLNARARADRLTRDGTAGREVILADGTRASAGDVILTRRNDRRLPITATDWVKNGDRWTVLHARPDGALTARHHGTGRRITLPPGYVAEHVVLGYATTVHAAQGVTADTCHSVATGEETRQLLYVALTRGRHGNQVYLDVASDGDPHAVITRDALLPPTAVDVLIRALGRDGSPASATSTARDLTDPATRLAGAADAYFDALTTAAERHLGAEAMPGIDTTAEAALPGLTDAPAYPALRGHLALLTVDGDDPAAALLDAVAQRSMDGAGDVAAVLDWRLTADNECGGPLPWLPAIPAALAADDTWGRYLDRRQQQVTELADAVRDRTRAWTASSAPAWAQHLPARDPGLVADLAVWRAAMSVDDADHRLTGPPQQRATDHNAQRNLDRRIEQLLGDRNAPATAWAATARAIDPRLERDPYWPVLAERFAAAARAGIDIHALATTVAAARPLPDELPAAALWWRLAEHLTPAALTATATSRASTLRPEWTPVLTSVVGAAAAEAVLADPAWPALVAAVTIATGLGWTPDQAISAAYELLVTGHGDDTPLWSDELAEALTWRVGLLTDPGAPPTTGATAAPLPAEPPAVELFDDTPAYAGENERPAATDTTAIDPPPPFLQPLRHDNRDDETDAPVPCEALLADRAATTGAHGLWEQPAVSGARVRELNTVAAAFFAGHYAGSWAPRYLRDRLGTDLTGDPRFAPGHAPAGWTKLVDHLRGHGASDDELLGAGLAKRVRTGNLIDTFRDRLVLPIRDQHGVIAFVARRHPDADDTAGPKYLNTGDTPLYSKGQHLYGLIEAAHLLTGDASPVLVEGPVDALAVTLAGGGHYVGIATLGTAVTDTQADQLAARAGLGRHVIVATDPDPAGRKAATRAYWQLTRRSDQPRHLALPEGVDPADLLSHHGPHALRTALDDARDRELARVVVDERINRYGHQLDTAEGRIAAVRAAAQAVAPLPPLVWPTFVEHIARRTDVDPATIQLAVFEAGRAYTDDPDRATDARLAERTLNLDPAQRWERFAAHVDPRLPADPTWPALAHTLDTVQAAGFDVAQQLRTLSTALPDDAPATTLRYRLLATTPELRTRHRMPSVQSPVSAPTPPARLAKPLRARAQKPER